ncbi:MarR family winged helix-turn-helix transcriptional regulator [Halovulum sp. GXIMD14793]
MVADLGLTSARWQVLGELALVERPQPVSWHARAMGISRQGFQRTANALQKEGLVSFEANPKHKRARLVMLTPKGRQLYDATIARQVPWVNRLVCDLSSEDITTSLRVVKRLSNLLKQAR